MGQKEETEACLGVRGQGETGSGSGQGQAGAGEDGAVGGQGPRYFIHYHMSFYVISNIISIKLLLLILIMFSI